MSVSPPNVPVRAPSAPGRLGMSISATDLADYLTSLARWTADRRAELDRLDQAALAAPDADSYTPDLALALSVWQSVADRLDQLRRVWDGGRAGPAEREEMSRLIWARLDQAPAAARGAGRISGAPLGVSLVEASRLSDALVAALRVRLSFDPLAADAAARIAGVRAALRRCADLPGADERRLADLTRRLESYAADAAKGADVSGPLAALDASVALMERDLIVAAGSRRKLADDVRAARRRRDDLEGRGRLLRPVAARCRTLIANPPRLAVPDVDALGPVPTERGPLAAYSRRLDAVASALAVAEAAYARPIAELDELGGRLLAYRAKAVATGRAADPAVAGAYRAAAEALVVRPVRLAEAGGLVSRYQQVVSGRPTQAPEPDEES